MTTNQTIYGVPRELAERFAQYAESGKVAEQSMIEELRALLDAPAKPVEDLEADNVKLAADRAALSTELEKLRKAYRGVLAQLEAAQPQGEPVAWLGSGVPFLRREDATEYASYKDKRVTALYAEQPAPVAVVLPERKENHDSGPTLRKIQADGWNACLDEVTRLNTK